MRAGNSNILNIINVEKYKINYYICNSIWQDITSSKINNKKLFTQNIVKKNASFFS